MTKIRVGMALSMVALVVLGCSKGRGDATLSPDAAQGATFTIEGKAVQLTDGRSAVSIPDSSSKQVTEIVGDSVSGTLRDERGSGLALVLRQQTGGTGTFYYLAALLPHGGAVAATDTVFLGDRIEINGLELKDGIVTVDYMDRAPGDAMSEAPSEKKRAAFMIEGDRLIPVPEPVQTR